MVFVLVLILVFLLMLFLPIRFAVSLEDIANHTSRFYILKQQSTTGPNWVVIGDNNEMYANTEYVEVLLSGIDPQNSLRRIIQIDAINVYVVYGEIDSQDIYLGEEYPVINCTSFDIVYPIDRGNSLRFFVPKNYLTIFDFDLFHCFRKR